MEKLKQQLDALIKRLSNSEQFKEKLEDLQSIYPFSQYEYIISHLLAFGKLRIEEYYELRDDYINRNLYLPLFEIAPRSFGDTWALGHLLSIEPDFKRPNRKIDPNYKGEYDLFLNWLNEKNKTYYIKIEVKSSRMNDQERNDEPLSLKALASDSQKPFLMNFQQLKPKCCDVFLWIAIYRDKIKYWVINSSEIQTNKYLTPQHRNEATAKRLKSYKKEDVYEGQIFVTNNNIAYFDRFLSAGNELKNSVIKQYEIHCKASN